MSRHNLVLFAFGAMLISACSSDVFLVHNGNMPSDDKIASLKVGQTRYEVENLLGNPSSISPLDENVWLYMSSTTRKVAFLKPKILERDILTVQFDKNGKVESFSQLSKENGQEISIDKDKTSSEGHDIGFFKKYFGGVGAYMPFGNSKEQ